MSFTPECDLQLSQLGLSRHELIDHLQQEFRSHINYFYFDLEDYIMPLKSRFLIYLDKVAAQLQFKAIYRCTDNEAKLSSWNDILALYRRATRLPYREQPDQIVLQRGLLSLALRLHFEAESRIIKHFKVFEHLSIGPIVSELFEGGWDHPDNGPLRNEALGVTDWGPEAEQRLSLLRELSFHLNESAGARKEAESVGSDYRAGVLSVEGAVGPLVIALERSLQHIHKVLLRYLPSS
jgi:hypothetical protein